MTYLPYYVSILNFINGRSLSETTPPDPVTDTEQAMMGQAYAELRLLNSDDRTAITALLKRSLTSLEKSLKTSHGELDLLRRHGFTLHAKETLWLDVLDKALPLFESVQETDWAKGGKWVPRDYVASNTTNDDEKTVHALLVALIQFSVRELGRPHIDN